MNEPSLILFDGICNLCCWWVQFLIKQDKKAKFKFASLQSESGKNLTNTNKYSALETETIIFIRKKCYFYESTAILEILRELGGFWNLFLLFKLVPKKLRDAIYRFIAKRRYAMFGKRTSCLIPTPELQKRFLT